MEEDKKVETLNDFMIDTLNESKKQTDVLSEINFNLSKITEAMQELKYVIKSK